MPQRVHCSARRVRRRRGVLPRGRPPQAPTSLLQPLWCGCPPQGVVGSAAVRLTVRGAAFVSASRVRWNGQDRATTYVSDTLLTVHVAAGDVGSTGPVAVTVDTGPP